MKSTPVARLLAAALLMGGVIVVPAAVRYVNLNNANPAAPYDSWATAATGIQDAIDAALGGDEIVVTNGVYKTGGRVVYGTLSNRVAVTRPLTVRSVNGPLVTLIEGHQEPGFTNGDGAVRCVYLTNGAKLSGFTLTNGATRAVGGYPTYRESGGGGLWCESAEQVVVSNCVMAGNAAYDVGGGTFRGTLNNCLITGNSARSAGSAGGGCFSSFLNNCAIMGNSGHNGGGVFYGILNNCTVTGNSAGNEAGGAAGAVVNNSILYYNVDSLGFANYDGRYTGNLSNILNYCCTTPLPAFGEGNFTSEPQLVSASHLAATSPCRAAGNSAYSRGLDIDGQPWGSRPSVGCDEFHPGGQSGPLTVAITTSFLNVATGFDIRFRAEISGNPSTSAWDFGDRTLVSNKVYVSHAWQTPGDYAVVLRACNLSYPSGLNATAIVHVVAQPVHYVAAASTNPIAPYNSWETAATVIQDAVDAANVVGALVLVSNGVYQTGGQIGSADGSSNRVAVISPVMVRSVNGPDLTIINGKFVVRCVYLGSDAASSGFTLTNGLGGFYPQDLFGGGVRCESVSAVVSNCVLSGNFAAFGNGGSAGYGGGAFGGTLINCRLSGNFAEQGGGSYGGRLNNCVLSGNCGCDGFGNGLGAGAMHGTLNNCTVIGNDADNTAGGGIFWSVLNNCIVYSNSAPNTLASFVNYCCTIPLPSGGVGNFANPPLLALSPDGRPRLQSNSPCINSGFNGYAPAGSDPDGNVRIAGGTVDVGAYEFQSPASTISYAWLQGYGFPIDGSADLADPDGDNLSNYEEWRAATNPNDPLSILRLRQVSRVGNDLVLTWESVVGRSYFLAASTNLCPTACYERVANNIPGQPGTTSYTHAGAAGTAPHFYRVGAEE